jgi:hypothetical protein
MRVIEDSGTGELLQASDDDELFRVLRAHSDRAGVDVSDEALRERIARDAYDATDS